LLPDSIPSNCFANSNSERACAGDQEEEEEEVSAPGLEDVDTAESIAELDEALTALEQARMLVKSAETKVSSVLILLTAHEL